MGKKEEKSLKETIVENAQGFALFLYNKEEGTVLGRTGRGWARISVFYLFYYLFLAALFMISINLTLSCLDEETPYFQTRLQTPGVSLQPKLPSKVALNTDIRYSRSDPSKFVTHLEKFLEPYADQDFGSCNASTYADQYKQGKPCIYLKTNKIIGWEPHPFLDLKVETDRADNRADNSKAPALVEHLQELGVGYDPELMYISCYGLKEEDKNKLGAVEYFPKGAPGIHASNFPYQGKKKDESYLPPIMAVHFPNVEKNVEISVGCKAYALNILDDQRTNSGFMHFKIKIE